MRCSLLLPFLLLATSAFSQASALKDLEILSPDGTKLRATFYAAAKPGPGVLLLHMCNTTRKSWEAAARQLSEAGINALTIDNRGFGESGGPRYEGGSPDVQKQLQDKWPADFDAAWQFLSSQAGVDKTRLAAGGGSCGVDNAIKLAQRHPEVKALVLLAGSTDAQGLRFLLTHPGIPILTAAAADDQYNPTAPQLMQAFSEINGNPRNQFFGFPNGRHGTEIFGPHPELVRDIVAFYVDTLSTRPADSNVPVAVKKTPVYEFLMQATQPGGGAKAAAIFHDARKRDASAFLFPEFMLNMLAYDRLQSGATDDAIELFKLNTEAYPASANTYDSLSDGYLAAGKKDLSLAAEEKCLELLPDDPAPADFKAALKKSAEDKVTQLKAGKQ